MTKISTDFPHTIHWLQFEFEANPCHRRSSSVWHRNILQSLTFTMIFLIFQQPYDGLWQKFNTENWVQFVFETSPCNMKSCGMCPRNLLQISKFSNFQVISQQLYETGGNLTGVSFSSYLPNIRLNLNSKPICAVRDFVVRDLGILIIRVYLHAFRWTYKALDWVETWKFIISIIFYKFLPNFSSIGLLVFLLLIFHIENVQVILSESVIKSFLTYLTLRASFSCRATINFFSYILLLNVPLNFFCKILSVKWLSIRVW